MAASDLPDPDGWRDLNHAWWDERVPLHETSAFYRNDAVLDAGFVLRRLREHDFTVYERWPWMETVGDGVWRLPANRPALPLLYSLRAERPV